MKPYQNQDQIRLVLADVDGTLVTQEKVLTAKTKEAVSQLTAAGIAFAITSDRPPRGMQMVIKDVNLSTVVAGFNGGVYTTAKLDPIVMRDLPRDAAARIYATHRKPRKQAQLFDALLRTIASDLVPLRPERSEPRARKRRPKNYQLLTKPRKEMCTAPHRNRPKNIS